RRRPSRRWRRSVPTLEVRFQSGFVTTCVIEPGALHRLPALCAAAGLTGESGLICDAKLTMLHRDALLALGQPLARPVNESRKTLAEVEAMCETLAARGIGRD